MTTLPDRHSRLEKALTQSIRENHPIVGKENRANHALVLAETLIHEHEHGNEYIVLCITPGSFQPFVTWRMMVTTQQLADGNHGPLVYCFSGEYHRELERALSNYQQRVDENGGGIDESEPSQR
jgi:hypothetical protein